MFVHYKKLAELTDRINRLDFSLIAFAVAIVYMAAYLSYPALPGNSSFPEGWWGWWDQGKYIQSARAFAAGSLAPDSHWYPPGYALTAALFAKWMGTHPFFFPNLFFLIASTWIFIRIVQFVGLIKFWALLAFGLGVFGARFILDQYVVPWTTTPAMTLLLAICLLYLQTIRNGLTAVRGALIGASLVSLAVTRPTDVICVLPLIAHIALAWSKQLVRQERSASGLITSLTAVVVTGLILTGLAVLLHWGIYGWGLSPYSVVSTQFGLDAHLIPFRFYALFVSPTGFYGEGRGIIAQYPPIAIGLIGLIYCIFFFRRYWALPVSVLAYICIYLSYPDFLPTGLWRYMNFHYLKWVLPMLGVFAMLMIQDVTVRASKARVLLIALLSVGGGGARSVSRYRPSDGIKHPAQR